jgi:glycerophosphoryl diester phosphodiesterase
VNNGPVNTAGTARRPVVMAHRGASRRAPENTVAAFRLARQLGAGWVELDVRLARDGALVVHHDAHYSGGRAICEVDAADRPPAVPLLDEALDACEGMGVNVEIKNAPGEPGHDPSGRVADTFVAALHARAASAAATPPILVSSFDAPTLARVRELDARIATALLTFQLDDPAAVIAACVAAGHRALHPFDATVDASLVRVAHEAGLAVNVWTVDDASRIAQLVALGVDGICTNVPDVAATVLDGMRA